MNTTNTTEEEIEIQSEAWHMNTDRFEKMEYLYETCSSEHLKECQFLNEIVRWMGEDDFDEFFRRHCQLWSIKTPVELDYAINS